MMKHLVSTSCFSGLVFCRPLFSYSGPGWKWSSLIIVLPWALWPCNPLMVCDICLHGIIVRAPSGTGLVTCCSAIVLRDYLPASFILFLWMHGKNLEIRVFLFCFVSCFFFLFVFVVVLIILENWQFLTLEALVCRVHGLRSRIFFCIVEVKQSFLMHTCFYVSVMNLC